LPTDESKSLTEM